MSQMSKLFEKFVPNFHKIHLDKANYKVQAPKLKWNLDDEDIEEDTYMLPEMRTDIVVENKLDNY